MINVEQVIRPHPIYMIGDSHSLIFNDLIFYESDILKQYFITRPIYCRGLTAHGFCDDTGQINPDLIQLLKFHALIASDFKPVHMMTSGLELTEVTVSQKSKQMPLIVFQCGDIDLRQIFLKEFGLKYDFHLPEEIASLNGLPQLDTPRSMVAFELVEDFVQKLIEPMFNGLKRMSKAGIGELFLHSLVPPIVSDYAFEKINEFTVPAIIRYKATLLFNHLLEKACLENDIYFLDVWPELTDNHILKDQYILDGIHLNRQACLQTIKKLLHMMTFEYNYRPALASQYQKVLDLATSRFENTTSDLFLAEEKEFKDKGILILEEFINQSDVQFLNESLAFNMDVGNRHYALDWTGNGVEAFSDHLKTAEPSNDVLRTLYQYLFQSDHYAKIRKCLGFDFTVFNCRPVKSLPHDDMGEGPQAFHGDSCPMGIYRLIIYLNDVNQENGPFEYYKTDQTIEQVHACKGTGFLFDANRLIHRANPPRVSVRKALDLVLAPLIPGQSPQVLWSGMNNWPVNPFNYSVSNMKSFPENVKVENQFLNLIGENYQVLKIVEDTLKDDREGKFDSILLRFNQQEDLFKMIASPAFQKVFLIIAFAFWHQRSMEKFQNYILSYRERFFQSDSLIGREYLIEYLNIRHEVKQPLQELINKNYSFVFSSSDMNMREVFQATSNMIVCLGDVNNEDFLNELEIVSNAFPQKEVIFYDHNELSLSEQINLLSGSDSVFAPHCERGFELAIIATLYAIDIHGLK